MTLHNYSRFSLLLLLLFSLLLFGLLLEVSRYCRLDSATASSSTIFTEENTKIVAALAADPHGLDPALLTDPNSLSVTAQIYETLVVVTSSDFMLRPGLAKSWSVSGDGLSWSFEIRRGVKFHDNSDLNAQAAAYYFQRWRDPAHPQHDPNYEYFNYLFGGPKGDLDTKIVDITAPSATTMVITLKEVDNQLPSKLSGPFFAIASPAALAAGKGSGSARLMGRGS